MDCIKMVVTMNPCKCGYYGIAGGQRCTCQERDVRRYLARVSRPLLDRIDLQVEARQVPYADLTGDGEEERSAQIRSRVERAQLIQRQRYQDVPYRFNSELPVVLLKRYCLLDAAETSWMEQIYERKHLTARSYHRLLKVARTIADLDGAEQIAMRHLNEAVLYRTSE